MKTFLIISGIIVFIFALIIIIIKHISEEDKKTADELGSRDYWRYKKGGID